MSEPRLFLSAAGPAQAADRTRMFTMRRWPPLAAFQFEQQEQFCGGGLSSPLAFQFGGMAILVRQKLRVRVEGKFAGGVAGKAANTPQRLDQLARVD